MTKYNCAIVRGGTSKGIYLRSDELPADEAERDFVISSLFGSPDPRQVNGLGGGDPLTSKVALLGSPSHVEADVDYRSGEVRLGSHEVNYGIMCGNLASGVGIAAHALGLIDVTQMGNTVRVFNNNTNTVIHVTCDDLNKAVTGVESTVDLTFFARGGGLTGTVLPTREKKNHVSIDGYSIEYSAVDTGIIYVFAKAASFGLTGHESPAELDGIVPFRACVEKLRSHVCSQVNELNETGLQVGQIKVAIVADKAMDGDSPRNQVVGRIINPQKTHKAYAVSGAIATGTASAISGTVVNGVVDVDQNAPEVRIAHPEGVMSIDLELTRESGDIQKIEAKVQRLARLLMVGEAFFDGSKGDYQ